MKGVNDELINKHQWQEVLDVIGAKKATISVLSSRNKKTHKAFSQGKGITLSEVRSLRETWRYDRPFIDADGNPFVLYIYDQTGSRFREARYRRRGQDSKEYKYHVCWCSTLEKMTSLGRRARYKAKYDVDNNIFSVLKNEREGKIEMNVCKNCLTTMSFLNYSKENYVEKIRIYNEFDIAYFFSLNLPKNLLKPTHQFYSGRYTKDWHRISKAVKEGRGNRCEECNSSKHLQVHHINGVKDDNHSTNLKVLCYNHHSQQPLHQHMKIVH